MKIIVENCNMQNKKTNNNSKEIISFLNIEVNRPRGMEFSSGISQESNIWWINKLLLGN